MKIGWRFPLGAAPPYSKVTVSESVTASATKSGWGVGIDGSVRGVVGGARLRNSRRWPVPCAWSAGLPRRQTGAGLAQSAWLFYVLI
ncbi:MAG: hypothetical protein OEZ02_04285 [Anaerolineae bacterium]|nr:hypothetical protein [Anaerolineae bacterium]